MTEPARFALYNLLPALVSGAVAWALVHAGAQAFGIRHGKLRLCLYSAPLIKSTLVLLGLTLVLPWPRSVFAAWNAGAVPPQRVIPVFMLLTGVAILGRAHLIQRSIEAAVGGARPVADDSRLAAALERVLAGYERTRTRLATECALEAVPPRPRLMVSDSGPASPLVTTAGEPTVVFPAALEGRLDDAELEGALAHELAHLQVRGRLGCLSTDALRGLVLVNPMAALMSAQLDREEEKACDDVAVTVVGDPDRYAGMLLESYRFAAGSADGVSTRLRWVPQLLGIRPALSERIERLLEGPLPDQAMWTQYAAFVILWAVVVMVLFQS